MADSDEAKKQAALNAYIKNHIFQKPGQKTGTGVTAGRDDNGDRIAPQNDSSGRPLDYKPRGEDEPTPEASNVKRPNLLDKSGGKVVTPAWKYPMGIKGSGAGTKESRLVSDKKPRSDAYQKAIRDKYQEA